MSAPIPPTIETISGEKSVPNFASAIIAGAVVNTEVKNSPATNELAT